MYKVGDKVVYPHHGAGTVVKKETREVLGEKREYLTIKILHNDMTVNVPADNADRVGLRKVIDEQMVSKVLKALTGSGTTMPKNWNRRFKHNRDKMKTGDIFELAEVVRNLSLRDHEKGLSTGEKQMFVKAKKILASELMYAKDMDEEECAEWLDGVLASELAARKFIYTRSDGSQWTLALKDMIDRMTQLEMAYNVNDCVELRWGAPDRSDEASTCKRHASSAQRGKMAEYRAWFHERRRPPRA